MKYDRSHVHDVVVVYILFSVSFDVSFLAFIFTRAGSAVRRTVFLSSTL